jgi:hypothetical protein
MISHYRFGSITYKEKTFTRDLIILKGPSGEKILSNWWRKEGHYLQVEDLKEVFAFKPQYLIVGTGASGVMQIDPKVKERADDLGIILEAYLTERAVQRFNELLSQGVSLAGAFHLTC